MILSQTAMYALRATLSLAESASEGPVRVDDVAARLDVPRNYLSKILHTLARRGILTSTRGPGGGFQLARPAESTLLAEVVAPFDDLFYDSACLLGRDVCSDDDPCPAHDRWRETSESVRRFFHETSIADLSHAPRAAEALDGG